MQNEITIRPMGPADRPAVVRLWHDAWHDGHGAALPPEVVAERTPATFAERIGPLLGDSIVAEDAGEIVGFAALDGEEIDQFYVAASRRGSGLAARLLAAAEAELLRRGITVARLQCSVGNERARRFYARSAWTHEAIRDLPIWTPDGRSHTHPTHVFVKRLSNLD